MERKGSNTTTHQPLFAYIQLYPKADRIEFVGYTTALPWLHISELMLSIRLADPSYHMQLCDNQARVEICATLKASHKWTEGERDRDG